MSKEKFPVTPATRLLREHNSIFTGHLYPYENMAAPPTARAAWVWTSTA